VIEAIKSYCYCLDQSNAAKSRTNNVTKYKDSQSEHVPGIQQQPHDSSSVIHPQQGRLTYKQQTLGQFTSSSEANTSHIPSNGVGSPAIDHSNFAASARLPPPPSLQTQRPHALPSAQARFAPQYLNPSASLHSFTPSHLMGPQHSATATPAPANAPLVEYSTLDSPLSIQTSIRAPPADSALPQPVSHSHTLPGSIPDRSGHVAANNSMNSASHNHGLAQPLLTPTPPATHSPEARRSGGGTEDVDGIVMSLLSVPNGQSSKLLALANNPESLRRVTVGLLSDPTFTDMVCYELLSLSWQPGAVLSVNPCTCHCQVGKIAAILSS